jgi:leucyl-tRNA synthetase
VFNLDIKKIEKKWQKKWEKEKIFEANVDKKKKKFFTSFVIPYTNGGLHIGHTFSFTRTDALARFKRMQGFNVLAPMSFHVTGETVEGTIERLKKGEKAQIDTFRAYEIGRAHV